MVPQSERFQDHFANGTTRPACQRATALQAPGAAAPVIQLRSGKVSARAILAWYSGTCVVLWRRRQGRHQPAGDSALATDLALPATKSDPAVCGRFDARELHPDPVDASPDDLRRAPNSGERVLNIEGSRQPALPAKRELGSASRYIADTTRQRAALRHEHLCGSIDGASGVSPSVHFSSACAKVLNKAFTATLWLELWRLSRRPFLDPLDFC